MNELHKLTPSLGSCVLETNFFECNWPDAFWGANCPRLRAVKDKYDPAGLFFVHHGEDWSEDGFTRVKGYGKACLLNVRIAKRWMPDDLIFVERSSGAKIGNWRGRGDPVARENGVRLDGACIRVGDR